MAGIERSRWERIVWILILLLLPFGEGGAKPEALLTIHTLVFLALGFSGFRKSSSSASPLLPPGLQRPAPLFLALAFLASVNSPYPYASFLRCWDLSILLITFVLVRRVGWSEHEKHNLLDWVLLSATLQAL